MDTPMISVALPVYNGANYIREALDSILAQDYRDFVLVVSDNCSTDETPQILDEYARRDSRVIVNRSDEFLSQADNVNRAIDLCPTEWVKLFCHDDIMFSHCLRRIHRIITEFSDSRIALIGDAPGWQFCNGYRFSPYSNSIGEPKRWNGRELMKRNLSGLSIDPLPALSTATVRKSAFRTCSGFDHDYLHFDTFLWSTLLLEWDFIFLPEFLVITRIHGAQVAVDARKSLRSIRDAQAFWPDYVRKHGNTLDLDRRHRLRSHLKGAASAASVLAIAIIKRQMTVALLRETAKAIPMYTYMLIPILVIRSLRSESRKIATLRGYATVEDVYPD